MWKTAFDLQATRRDRRQPWLAACRSERSCGAAAVLVAAIVRLYSPAETPCIRLNARLNAASES